MILRKKIVFILALTHSLLSVAQNLQWAKGLGGVDADLSTSTAVDNAGNVYVAGIFSGTLDFDPGASSYLLSSAGFNSAFILKLDSTGNFIWAKNFASGILGHVSINLDSFGNIYAAGGFVGNADFDPGPGVFTMISLFFTKDIFVLKLDNAGNFVWATRFGGPGTENFGGLAVDAPGNVFTTGSFDSVVDFNPGAGTYTISNTGVTTDVFVSKLDANGNFVWAGSMGGPGFEEGFSICLDGLGNICTTGYFAGTTDFDPGPGTSTLATNNTDAFISKLNPSGNFVWAKNLGGSGFGFGFSITSDVSGNIYSTGNFFGTLDFDPGVGIDTVVSVNGTDDIFISKLDASGNYVWAKILGGDGSGFSSSIKTDATGNVYTTGWYLLTTDFDPGIGTHTFSTGSYQNVFVSKLDGGGNFVWAKKMGGNYEDIGRSLSVDPLGNVYITGTYSILANFDTGTGTNTLSSVGNTDIFIAKLNSCPSPPESIKGLSSFCKKDGPTGYSINTISGANGYVWTVIPSGTIVTGQNTNSVGIVFASNSSTVFVKAANACANNSSDSLAVVLKNLANLNLATTTTLMCKGETRTLVGAGANSYTWSTAVHSTSIIVSPSVNTMYYVVGTGTNGCKSTATIELKVSSCIGLEESTQQLNLFDIYPNPTTGVCFITVNANSIIRLFSTNSTELINEVFRTAGKYSFDLSDLKAGLYFVEVQSNGTISGKKIIKN